MDNKTAAMVLMDAIYDTEKRMRQMPSFWPEEYVARTKDLGVALKKSVDAMFRLRPDKETGLVQCGCGGKASFHYDVGPFNEYAGTQRISVCAGCDDCKTSTVPRSGVIDAENKYDDVEKEIQNEAMSDWNRAMGYEEETK